MKTFGQILDTPLADATTEDFARVKWQLIRCGIGVGVALAATIALAPGSVVVPIGIVALGAIIAAVATTPRHQP